MLNIFEQFPVVRKIVTYLSWDDLNSFKKLNTLCYEVTESEEIQRCHGICFGHQKLESNKKISVNRRRIIINDSITALENNFRCKNPKLVLIMSNENDKKSFLEKILNNQCHLSSIICYAYYHHGNIGSSHAVGNNKLTLNYTFNRRSPAFSWLCLPKEIDAELITEHSEMNPNTKLIIVLNSCTSKQKYPASLFPNEASREHQIYYGGGLVKTIELYNHEMRCFVKSNHISIGLGGENLNVYPVIITEDHCETEALRMVFEYSKSKHDEYVKNKIIKYQCVIVFSCYSRNSFLYQSEQNITEYELFAEYFPHIPISGIMCRAQIFRCSNNLIKLVQSLHDDDLEELTSVYLILTWTDN